MDTKLEWWLPGTEGGGEWGDVGQSLQTFHYKMSKFRDLRFSMAALVNNPVYLKVAMRIKL